MAKQEHTSLLARQLPATAIATTDGSLSAVAAAQTTWHAAFACLVIPTISPLVSTIHRAPNSLTLTRKRARLWALFYVHARSLCTLAVDIA